MNPGNSDIAALNARIRAHADTAAREVAELADYCAYDESLCTPLDVAIEHDNRAVFDVIVASKVALDYTPPLDEALVRKIKLITRDHFDERIEALEAFLERSVGQPLHWMRPPILQACRHRNLYALGELVKRGAKLGARDVVGCSAPELCHMTGGDELVGHFIDVCAAAGRKIPVTVAFLDRIIAAPQLYGRALVYGSLNATAKRKVFNLACALLDLETVGDMLAAGHNVNNSKIDNSTPLTEAATSRMLWTNAHPESRRLAAALHRVYDMGRGLVFTGADLTKVLSDLENMSEAEQVDYLLGDESEEEQSGVDLMQAPRPEGINPKPHDAALLERRLRLIDLLAAHGLTADGIAPHHLEDLLSDVIAINEPGLLDKLVDCGLDFSAASDSQPVQWAIQIGCYDMVAALEKHGFACPKVESHWIVAYDEYRGWRDSS